MGDYESKKQGVLSRMENIGNKMMPRETRKQTYDNISSFAQKQPLLFSFVAVQLSLALTPILLFTTFVVSTIIFSFASALFFSLFWIGAALLVLVPSLFTTVALGIAIWAWAIGSFVVAKWLYSIIPVSVRGKAAVDMPNGKTLKVKKTGDGYGDVKAEVEHTHYQ